MAVFFDTGGGDIYGGESREACIEAMRRDVGDDLKESAVFEVPGTRKIELSGEDEEATGKFVTLDEEYTPEAGAYCVATDNG